MSELYGLFGIPALIALTISAALSVRWMAARYRLEDEARSEYEDRCLTKKKTVRGVDEAAFVTLYTAAHEPRWALYTGGALIGAVVMTPVAAIGLTSLWPMFVATTNGGPWYEVGYYPWMFYMFFGFCAVWAFCAYVAARIHHVRAPEPYQAALARARGEPLDDVVLKRKRPAWAVKARPSWAPDLPKKSDKASSDTDETK